MTTQTRPLLQSPIFAHFTHPDGSWYRLWITHSIPKTERGHPWHLHATYDKSGTLAPVAGTRWYEQTYGMANWDFGSDDDVLVSFRARAQERLDHGYELREGAIPDLPAEAF
ncbi:MAG: hypothetical protein H7Z41_03985 [Cytophagales bacterium]|nr:hypothetical protein [Armatimonadota bacterium]